MMRRSPRPLLIAALCALAWPLCAGVAGNQDWQEALPGYRYEFPRDHFNHPGYQTEWWYYTGNISTPDGRHYGFELTFFRRGVTRHAADEQAGSPWDVNDLYVAHLALSDLDGGRFYHTERMNRAGPGLAGADATSRRIWNGNWEVRFSEAKPHEEPAQQLQAVCDDFSLRLTLSSRKPPVIHGVAGVSQKAAGRGQASHYISYTRLEASGTLEIDGRSWNVSGLTWMDHEFFTHQLSTDQVGWDWISIQLTNGEDLMLYRLRHSDGSADPYSAGTFVDAHGTARHLTASDFSFAPEKTWDSPETEARYPIRWSIMVPSLRLELEVMTPLNSQELVSIYPNWPTYWEGAVTLRGIERAQPVDGSGYLEMTGYDRPMILPH